MLFEIYSEGFDFIWIENGIVLCGVRYFSVSILLVEKCWFYLGFE